jgi:hypothetical protein
MWETGHKAAVCQVKKNKGDYNSKCNCSNKKGHMESECHNKLKDEGATKSKFKLLSGKADTTKSEIANIT